MLQRFNFAKILTFIASSVVLLQTKANGIDDTNRKQQQICGVSKAIVCVKEQTEGQPVLHSHALAIALSAGGETSL